MKLIKIDWGDMRLKPYLLPSPKKSPRTCQTLQTNRVQQPHLDPMKTRTPNIVMVTGPPTEHLVWVCKETDRKCLTVPGLSREAEFSMK